MSAEKAEALAGLAHFAAQLKAAQERTHAHAILARMAGASWSEIGALTGISKQAAQQKYGRTPAVEPKMAVPDVAGPSVTPSIFLDPIAPAKVRTPAGMIELGPEDLETGMPKTDTWTEPRKHGAILPGPKPKVAQPGTGKGPHLCPGCQSTNHHGSKRNTIVWNDGCIPTKYDPPATVEFMNARTRTT